MTQEKQNIHRDHKTDNADNAKKRAITSKQVVAMAGVVLLALLYIITLVVAVIDNSASGRLFLICLFATIAVPILIWIYIWMYGKLTGKRTMSDLNIGGDKKERE